MTSKKYLIVPGQRFGHLTVLNEVYLIKNGHKHRYTNCICDCGKETSPRTTSLFDNNTKSCGCSRYETVHNKKKKNWRHETPIYFVFRNMKNRCYRKELPDYKNYGGRGIVICKEWKNDFDLFYEWAISHGYKEGLTIERKDNNKGYSPDNCVFTNRIIQCNNRRNTVIISYDNEKISIGNFCRKHGLHYKKFYDRIMRYNWAIEKAMKNCI